MGKWLKKLWARIRALFLKKAKVEDDVSNYGLEIRNAQNVEVSATSNNHFIVEVFTPTANGAKTYPMFGNDVIEAYIESYGFGDSYSYYTPTQISVVGGVVSWSGIGGSLRQGKVIVIRRGLA